MWVSGYLTHGGSENFFDIGIINQYGYFDDRLLDPIDAGNNGIIGYCTPKKLIYYIEKIGSLPD